MNRHLLIVANAFRAVGLLLGIPSLLVCLRLTALKIELAWFNPEKSVRHDSHAIDIQRDGLVGILVALGTMVGKGLEVFGNTVGWVAGILDIAAAVLTLVAGCLFLTGRGLVLHAVWARIVAGLVASGLLLVSFMTMTALRRGAAFALIPIAVSIYMLWVLIRRFS